MVVSADLQKVVMLPRAEIFKKVIFIVLNESFVPAGKGRTPRPLGVLRHEEISGRKKEHIVSAFYAFFLKNRDKESITIGLDNCSGQNKNWCLFSFFSFFVYLVNADEFNLRNLTVKYFERRHTFMSAFPPSGGKVFEADRNCLGSQRLRSMCTKCHKNHRCCNPTNK